MSDMGFAQNANYTAIKLVLMHRVSHAERKLLKKMQPGLLVPSYGLQDVINAVSVGENSGQLKPWVVT